MPAFQENVLCQISIQGTLTWRLKVSDTDYIRIVPSKKIVFSIGARTFSDVTLEGKFYVKNFPGDSNKKRI